VVKYLDGLICGVCRGDKVLIERATGKNYLCPKCMGSGYLPNSEDLKEQKGKKKRVLLKG
jgi:hypothetical protein